MKAQPRFAALIFAAVALASPAGAQAATLGVSNPKACYGGGDIIGLAGSGYTPNQPVDIAADGRAVPPPAGTERLADAAGNVALALRVGPLAQPERVATFSATDRSNPANTAATQVRVSRLNVGIRPAGGNPRRPRRIRTRGWTVRGTTVFAHIRRKGFKRDLRVGKLKGACRTSSKRVRLFGRGARPGRYRVQFDTYKRFKRTRAQRVTFRVTIRRIVRRATASGAFSSSLTERWKLLDSPAGESIGG